MTGSRAFLFAPGRSVEAEDWKMLSELVGWFNVVELLLPPKPWVHAGGGGRQSWGTRRNGVGNMKRQPNKFWSPQRAHAAA